MRYNCETERLILDVPTHCPRCNADLEVDTRYGEDQTIKTFLICSNESCDYELDATKEFEEAADAELEREIYEAQFGSSDGDDYHRYIDEE